MSKKLTKKISTSKAKSISTTIKFVEFAFDNRELIHLLEKRGNAIANANFDKMERIEEKINTFKSNEKNYNKMCRPTTGYFTFEEDACVQAIKKTSNEKLDFKFEGKLMRLEQAFEPSSVIWEARNWMRDWR